MSLFLQYNLAQALGDMGGGGGGGGGSWAGADAASSGFGFAMGLMMPSLIWQHMQRQGWGPAPRAGAFPPPPGPPSTGAPQPRFCGHCGAPLVTAARFCGHCGTASLR